MSTGVKFIVLGILFAAGIYLSLFFGGSEVLNWHNVQADFVFYQIRLPKTLTALMAGAALSVSGLVLQVIFRNPLAGPYVLGISSGASLAVAVSVMTGSAIGFFPSFFHGKTFPVVAAIIGALVMTLLILSISLRVKKNVILLLIGLMVAQICGAAQTVLEYFAEPDSLKNFVIWGMGSMSTTGLPDMPLFIGLSLIPLLASLFFVKALNAFLLGQAYAHNLGIRIKHTRFWLILISSALTGIVTAYCGPIAFVGIAVPILSRMVFPQSQQRIHLFACMLIGATMLMFADAFAHSLLTHMALPINMVTTFIGAPLLIYLMFKNKHW
jgi:iron complex transport system permease protein